MSDHADVDAGDACPRCGGRGPVAYACPACRWLDESRVPDDYFMLLGVPAGFDVDVSELRRRFLLICRLVHPDGFSLDASQAEAAVRISARLNDAFETLADPARRADYLLQRAGGPRADDDRGVDPDVLTDTMMLRERIEQATNSDDASALGGLADEVARKQAIRLEEVMRWARSLDDGDGQTRTALRRALNALTYYDNMNDMLWNARSSG